MRRQKPPHSSQRDQRPHTGKLPFRPERPDRPAPRREAKAAPAPHRAPQEPGTTWLYGRHAVLAALANPFREILRLAATPDAASRSDSDLVAAHAKRGGQPRPLETLDRTTLDALLPRGAVHQGIAVLVAPLPESDLAAVVPSEPAPSLVVVLDQVTDPHNVGAILRSSVAFGAHAVIVTERHAPEETGTLAKSASGALEHMPLLRVTNLVRTIEELKQVGFWVVGLAGEAEQTLAQAKLTGRVALVLGAEGDGLRRLTREHCDLLVRLPINKLMPSLNVSNAAAVALYELARS
ncbi:MAG: 23S rRNA (guanosine(2251)-2'-O)-methyltransferase RlmB [Rhodospirillales bacterium]